jgi:hypothetical protein
MDTVLVQCVFQSLVTGITFFYSVALELQWHVLIQCTGAVVSCVGIILAENYQRQRIRL